VEIPEREVKKIPKDIIRTSGGQLVFRLRTGNSDTLESGSLRCPDSGGGILKSHGPLGRTVDALADQAINARVGFPFANLVARDNSSEVCQ
jgi:hypothetical protein